MDFNTPMLKLTLIKKKWRFTGIIQIFDNTLFLKCPIYGVFTLYVQLDPVAIHDFNVDIPDRRE